MFKIGEFSRLAQVTVKALVCVTQDGRWPLASLRMGPLAGNA